MYKKCLTLMLVMALTLVPFSVSNADDETKRFQAMGGEVSSNGFTGFPSNETPFKRWQRARTGRLRGQLMFYNSDRIRIRHSFYCATNDAIFVELWVPDGNGEIIPFAWVDINFDCRAGGTIRGRIPFYIDINGDGKPDARYPAIDTVSTERFQDTAITRTFNDDILPAWVKNRAGDSLRSLSSTKYPVGNDYYRDDANSLTGDTARSR